MGGRAIWVLETGSNNRERRGLRSTLLRLVQWCQPLGLTCCPPLILPLLAGDVSCRVLCPVGMGACCWLMVAGCEKSRKCIG
jgi:hypothetical protein